MFAIVSTGADTNANTWEPNQGRGAPELLNLRLLEDGSERSYALSSDSVHSETASQGQDGNGEWVGVSMGADRNANTWGSGALERGHGAPLETLAQLGDTLGSVGALAKGVEAAELIVGQPAGEGGSVNGN